MEEPKMGTKPGRRKPSDWIQPLFVAICVAGLTAAVGTIWNHEQRILGLDRDISRLRVHVYRQQIKNYEILEAFFRARIQLIDIRRDDNGKLSKMDQAQFNYFVQAKESLVIVKENYVEEHKHEGKAD